MDLNLGESIVVDMSTEPDANGAFSSVRLSLAIVVALGNLVVELFNMQGREIATEQQIADDLAQVGFTQYHF